jgi:polyhydroxybutyrate depolymerase
LRKVAVVALAIAAAVALLYVLASRRHRSVPVHVYTLEAGESEILPRATPSPGSHGATTSRAAKLRVDDRERSYVLVSPAALDANKRYPLVLVFHGDGGDAAGFHAAFPFERASGADAFVAYPDGIGYTWDLESKLANRDVAFVEALVDELARTLPIDRTHVFGTGYSSGGFLANVIACQKSGLFRAIASNAGGAPYRQALLWPNGFTRCPGQAPIAMMALHGLRDFGVDVSSGRFSAAYWAYVNGCDEAAMETTGYTECTAYRGCPAGKPVVYCEIPSLGHWVWDEAATVSWSFFLRQ